MNAYKFLAAGAVGRFSDHAWPQPTESGPGAWVDAGAPLTDCLHGVHAVRAADMLDWIDDELWEIELDGEIVEQDSMLVAARGRLVRRVEAWDEAAARDFADACAWRTRKHALSALRRIGLTEEAERLVAAAELTEMQAVAGQATVARESPAAELTALAADSVSLARGRRPEAWRADPATLGAAPAQTPGGVAANLGFVVAHTAGREAVAEAGTEDAYGGGFAEERAWQLAWLTDRLALRD